MDLLGISTVTGEIGFKPIDQYYFEYPDYGMPLDIWFLNDLYLEYDGFIGICDLTVGGGFNDIRRAEGPEYSFLYNPPPVEGRFQFGLGLSIPTIDWDFFALKGTFVAGGKRIGIIAGRRHWTQTAIRSITTKPA
ncbi:MAG: hypothetical protein LBT83_00420 [Tannerella sp.]|nr:hypothetical protein [Tannerella sp.]